MRFVPNLTPASATEETSEMLIYRFTLFSTWAVSLLSLALTKSKGLLVITTCICKTVRFSFFTYLLELLLANCKI